MSRLQQTVFERNVPARAVVDHALGEARHGVLWLDDVDGLAGYPALTAPTRADVAVVGGGYTGLWSALLAKQRHPAARVVLLEGRSVGWAASGRNAGFCGARLVRHDRGGPSDGPGTLARLGQDNLAAIGSAVDHLGLGCQWERTGTIDLAIEPHQIDWLQDTAARAARTGAPHTYLDRAKLRSEIASPTYEAGLVRPDDAALVHPALLATELARAASELGVEIFQQTRVTGLALAGRGPGAAVVLRTTSPDGGARVLADRVLLGTSAFPSLLRRYRRHTVAARAHLVATEPLSAELRGAIGWRGRQGLADLANRSHHYRLTADDRIVFGAYGGDSTRDGHLRGAPGDEPYRRLAEHLLTTFPQLEGVRLTHRWSGVTDVSTRSGGLFGQAAGGRVQHAAGLGSCGVAGSHFAAQVMLDRLDAVDGRPTTERAELETVRRTPVPFPPEPVATAAVRAARRALDRADHHGGHRSAVLRSLDALGLDLDT